MYTSRCRKEEIDKSILLTDITIIPDQPKQTRWKVSARKENCLAQHQTRHLGHLFLGTRYVLGDTS